MKRPLASASVKHKLRYVAEVFPGSARDDVMLAWRYYDVFTRVHVSLPVFRELIRAMRGSSNVLRRAAEVRKEIERGSEFRRSELSE
ncbi:MAG: hypothetical protein M0R66_01185 [Candidatus Omnitrophica bacterium]|nr:hypothetical protein [Candidatus Omnitrophota bacterium]